MCAEDKPSPQADLAPECELAKTEEAAPPKDHPKAIFTVMIVGTHGIRNAERLPGLGTSSCYCEVTRGGTPIHKTRTDDNSREPHWAEEFGVLEYEIGESLEFKVWDSNVGVTDCLGKVILTPDAFMERGCNMEFPMEQAGKIIGAYLELKIKVTGQEQYPDGTPHEFEITVEKGEGAMEYGLVVDNQDLKTLHILQIHGGAFKNYNERVKPPLRVIPSDFIVYVNGVTGDAKEMLKAFSGDRVNLKLVRAVSTVVFLERDKKKRHGLKFPKVQVRKTFLVVMDVEDGYIKEHNDKCEDESQKILVYDRIVSVKGQVGTAASLKSQLEKATGKLQLGIQRPYPEDASTKVPGGMSGFF